MPGSQSPGRYQEYPGDIDNFLPGSGDNQSDKEHGSGGLRLLSQAPEKRRADPSPEYHAPGKRCRDEVERSSSSRERSDVSSAGRFFLIGASQVIQDLGKTVTVFRYYAGKIAELYP